MTQTNLSCVIISRGNKLSKLFLINCVHLKTIKFVKYAQ